MSQTARMPSAMWRSSHAPCYVACVVGARPNFMKMAALLTEFERCPEFAPWLIHTGQHFSPELSQVFFADLEMPAPDVSLEVPSGSPSVQTAEIMQRLSPLLQKRRPDLLLVVGDVTSTVAAALAAVRLGIPVAHVEAGLRNFDFSMPEERNRFITDSFADLLFVSEPSGVVNLRREGIAEERVHFVGNVMIDTLLRFRGKAAQSTVLSRLALAPQQYAVATLHRQANVDDNERLCRLMSTLTTLAEQIPVVLPLHPRTRDQLRAAGFQASPLLLTPPQPYTDFIHLLQHAKLVLTDSGGVQEETTILQVPCLTLRENTERPVTLEQGTNYLVGLNPEQILQTARGVLAGEQKRAKIPELWDGHAAHRIVNVLREWFTGQQEPEPLATFSAAG